MKMVKVISIAGLILVSMQLKATVVESNQIMPPPGPYKSIMSNSPPIFVPFGSRQGKVNPYNYNKSMMLQNFSNFPVNSGVLNESEWQGKQQENRDKIEKMFKDNESRNKENENDFSEYLKKIDALAMQRNEESKKWITENNKKMKKYWQDELSRFSENQKNEIEKIKELPDWIKNRMISQQQKQLEIMKKNSVVAGYGVQGKAASPYNYTIKQPVFFNEAPKKSEGRALQPNIMQKHPMMYKQQAIQRNNVSNQFYRPMPQGMYQRGFQGNQLYRAPGFNMPLARQYPPVSVPMFMRQPNTNPYNQYSR